MIRLLQIIVAAWAILSSSYAFAVQPDEVLSDPALEARARGLSKELRCMVCQNQSIDDSDAPLARDLRLLVRERLVQGDSDSQVIDFLVARYGEFVLLRPRLTAHTAVLWIVPPGLLLGGIVTLMFIIRRRKAGGLRPEKPAGGELSPAEEARLATLLNSRET